MALGSKRVTLRGTSVRTFLFYTGSWRETIKVMGPPNYDGWARVLLYIDTKTGEVTPGQTGPGQDVLWMPGFERLLREGAVTELT